MFFDKQFNLNNYLDPMNIVFYCKLPSSICIRHLRQSTNCMVYQWAHYTVLGFAE